MRGPLAYLAFPVDLLFLPLLHLPHGCGDRGDGGGGGGDGGDGDGGPGDRPMEDCSSGQEQGHN